jgi:glucose/mannose-6-phosphate isomerase
MGGSGAAGDLLAVAAAESSSVPVIVHRSYGAPAFAGPQTFVIASSYSGETEETLDAFRAARAAGARGVALCSGGTLAAEAASAGWPVLEPMRVPFPRYALGWMTAAPLALLERVGLTVAVGPWRTEAPATLDARSATWGPSAPTQDNVTKALAHELMGALPVIWGSAGPTAAAAVRWKSELNENAKMLAHSGVLPEVDHNEIVGLAPEGREGRPETRRVLMALRWDGEDRRISRRYEVTLREVREDFDLVTECRSSGEASPTAFLELSLMAGFVSTYLAILRGVDPSRIDSISRLKAALGSP